MARVRFRYHDGTSWTASYDSLRTGRLPAAVEVAVWYDPWPGDDAPAPDAAGREPFDDRFGDAFDERAFALESDLAPVDDPWPDRVRVIAIDASPGAEETGP